MTASIYFASLLATAIAALILGFYTFRHRIVPGSGAFAWLEFTVFLLAVTEALSMLGESQSQALFWFRLRYTAAAAIFRFRFLKEAPASEQAANLSGIETRVKGSLPIFILIFIVMGAGIGTLGFLSYRDYKEVNLSGLAMDITAELKRREPARKVDVRIDPGMIVIGDAHLLRIAMENLLANAWKFTGKAKGPLIHVGMTELDGGRTFFVRDNGVGFDMAYADKLFVPFQRLHSMTEFPGTGIGLVTAQRIINRHGGAIRPEAEINRGATLYFTVKILVHATADLSCPAEMAREKS